MGFDIDSKKAFERNKRGPKKYLKTRQKDSGAFVVSSESFNLFWSTLAAPCLATGWELDGEGITSQRGQSYPARKDGAICLHGEFLHNGSVVFLKSPRTCLSCTKFRGAISEVSISDSLASVWSFVLGCYGGFQGFLV